MKRKVLIVLRHLSLYVEEYTSVTFFSGTGLMVLTIILMGGFLVQGEQRENIRNVAAIEGLVTILFLIVFTLIHQKFRFLSKDLRKKKEDEVRRKQAEKKSKREEKENEYKRLIEEGVKSK